MLYSYQTWLEELLMQAEDDDLCGGQTSTEVTMLYGYQTRSEEPLMQV